MTRHPAFLVVAGWALFNGLLLAVLAIYGEDHLAYWLYGGVVALLGAVALLVLLASRTEPERHVRYRLRRGGGPAALPGAAGVTLAVLSLVHGSWMLVLALPALVVAVVLLVRRTPTAGEG
ncbi:hypothetical protein [Streptomyces sp. NPDC018693]|uniref:hypothetical protein n=1 Tax=unclassified Streptomyces TaxID=2593676 RepID=UPI00378E6D4E